jgi:diguanylate cyclase (GGDEF)-like protein/PAS domain S-box-containing protein
MAKFDDPEILRSILEELPTGVYLVGRDGRILLWNYGAERITGYLRQDVVGHACREDFLGNTEGNQRQITAASAALEAVLKDGKAVESQVSFPHKAGHLVPVRLRAIPMKDAKGSIIGVVECLDELIPMAEWDRRHDKLAEYGCLDAASGLLNRKTVQSRLRECLATHKEQPVPFCIACVALDQLGEMKARYGAGAVAAVLRTAGLTLGNSLRPTDYLGRWQNNEFLAIMTECGRGEVISVGERLSKMIAGAKISWWGDSVPLTISMGATAAKAKDTLEEIMRRAEGALRQSISSGGNRMTLWND